MPAGPTRRELLLAAMAGAAAVGCGHGADSAAPTTTTPGTSTTPTSAPTTGAAPTAPSAGAPPTTPATPDLAAVVARHTGAVPTQWGTDVTGVDRTVADRTGPTMALTFDACGGPQADGVDQDLLALLEREHLPATLFLNARWVLANGPTVERILANPQFEVGNHGTRHLPLSVDGRSAYGIAGTRSVAEVVDEVWRNHDLLTRVTGRAPRWFRSGTAHYDEVATAVVGDLGEQPVGFTVNGDAGATYDAAEVRRTLLAPAAPGSVVIMHMIRPQGGTAEGLAAALGELRARGTRFVTLSGGGGAAT
jgi:peptidoglycan/xylan/chitin deacetylase (PgdA/CDA1 family)